MYSIQMINHVANIGFVAVDLFRHITNMHQSWLWNIQKQMP